MKRILMLVLAIVVFCSCSVNEISTIDKAVVQDKFYNPPGFKQPESFMLIIKYNDFCFHQFVSTNTFGNVNKGDSIDIAIYSTYMNGKLKQRYFTIIE